MKEKIFKPGIVGKLNPSDIPMQDTDFYQWLSYAEYDPCNDLDKIKQYLKSMGFVIGANTITPAELETLKIIRQHEYIVKRRDGEL